jgi:hypothetical protein
MSIFRLSRRPHLHPVCLCVSVCLCSGVRAFLRACVRARARVRMRVRVRVRVRASARSATIDPHSGRVTELYANPAYSRLAAAPSVPAHLAAVAANAAPPTMGPLDHLCW